MRAFLLSVVPTRKTNLDRDGEDLVDGVRLEVFDVPVSVPLSVTHRHYPAERAEQWSLAPARG